MLNRLVKGALRLYLDHELKSIRKEDKALNDIDADADTDHMIKKYANIKNNGDVDFELGEILRGRDDIVSWHEKKA